MSGRGWYNALAADLRASIDQQRMRCMSATNNVQSSTLTVPLTERPGRGDLRNTADLLRFEIQEFRSWRCHQDDAFNQRFVALQLWQVERLKNTHRHLLEDARYQAATEFFLSDMYGGLDLKELANEVERALPLASKLLPDSVLRTSGVALELNSITGELDQRMTEILFEEMGLTDITMTDYCHAYRQASSKELRYRQLDLVAELGLGLDRYVRSRVIYATFKLAHRPAHMAGLGGLYDFLGRGFAVMRPMGSAVDFIRLFAGIERQICDNIWAGSDTPFHVAHHL